MENEKQSLNVRVPSRKPAGAPDSAEANNKAESKPRGDTVRLAVGGLGKQHEHAAVRKTTTTEHEESGQGYLSRGGGHDEGAGQTPQDAGRTQHVKYDDTLNQTTFRGLKPIAFGTPIDEEMCEAVAKAAHTGEYELLKMENRGAESVLYRARAGRHEFCVKSIRNWLDGWIGDSRTRNNSGKLQNVSYRTKCRHLNNEFLISQMIENWEMDCPVVKILGLHRVTKYGLEIGYDLLMEYVQGHDLSEKMILRSLTLEDKMKIMYQATQALQFLHKRRIIHLDIKPSNFMLTRTGKIRLLDFGVSVLSGHQPNAIAGTVGFLSPEQICKESLDEGTDIFALGITFGILFGGKQLAQNHEELLQREFRTEAKRHLETSNMPALTDPQELCELPAVLEVLRSCTIYKREARIRSCATLLAQLAQAAAHYGISLT